MRNKSNDSLELDRNLTSTSSYLKTLATERRRVRRSGRPLVEVTLQTTHQLRENAKKVLREMLCAATRGTDVVAWHEACGAFNILCTETGESAGEAAGEALLRRLRQLLSTTLLAEDLAHISMSFEILPGPTPTPAAEPMAVREEEFAL